MKAFYTLQPHVNFGTLQSNPTDPDKHMTAFLNKSARLMVMGCAALLIGAGGTTMELKSQVFQSGAMIPSNYTCDGQDVSPPLSWSDPPVGTISFALISDDPDAPMGTWVHWVIWNIPASTRVLEENFPKTASLPNGTKQGTTDFHRVGYGGPCPPSGTHRYFFKLYALDTTLNLPSSTTKKDLEQAMQGHILGQTELMGTYRRR
ncbi:putative kinase inhibitor protein [Candidatus Methylomirabilis lanthanidiphila]|uniref:Putative kinase inhibitor protein n=1 Tax=Candidatus Methylomirabilis lanthanidiphila TaxID=2211376 RepID=A0A564ZHD9_9BACT|nr:putative kinase inhibitor protein [Candidatus Methylomirabilis lanthanidiphila]